MPAARPSSEWIIFKRILSERVFGKRIVSEGIIRRDREVICEIVG